MDEWLETLRSRHVAAFDERDWSMHVHDLNAQVETTGRFQFTESLWPPEFFVGALPLFEPGRWLAVVSLNPKEQPPEYRAWHEAEAWTAEGYWSYLTRNDLRGYKPADFYYRKWCYPLLLLLAGLTGDPTLLETPEDSYFYRVGSFELIPYSSHEYASGTFAQVSDDPGCMLARDTALAAIQNCPPVAVIANGLDAAAAVPAWLPLDAPVEEHRYESLSRPGKVLRHWQSSVAVDGATVPYAGFPFLRTQSGHNSCEEVRQLAREIVARA